MKPSYGALHPDPGTIERQFGFGSTKALKTKSFIPVVDPDVAADVPVPKLLLVISTVTSPEAPVGPAKTVFANSGASVTSNPPPRDAGLPVTLKILGISK
jgi:hypothetical protein